jgi:hypothetical protein
VYGRGGGWLEGRQQELLTGQIPFDKWYNILYYIKYMTITLYGRKRDVCCKSFGCQKESERLYG